MPDVHFPPNLERLFEPAPYKVLRGGRGGGKSWAVARALLLLGLQRKIRVLCTRETQKSIRESVHRLLVDQIARLGLAGYYGIQQVQITGLNGTEFIFAGLSDQTAASIKSFEGVDICWVEEAQVVTDNSWTILLPTLFRKEGGSCEVWITFNPELDSDPTWRRFVKDPPPGTMHFTCNWDDNPWFPKELDELRCHDERTLPAYEYEWIWSGKCKPAIAGAIYADEIAQMEQEKRICALPYDAYHLVYPVVDIGWNDTHSIGFWQRHFSSLRCIDYLEDDHRTWDWYSKAMRERQYSFGCIFLPHDGGHGNVQTGKTDQTILEQLGWRVTVLERKETEQGIRDTRMAMRQMAFDGEKCSTLIEHLRRYRRVIPPGTGEPAKPLHDEHSHGSDMVRYAAQAAQQMDDEIGMNLPPLKYGNSGLI